MAQIEVLLPKMGESVAEATITTWVKAEGDTIEAEESLVEIATDKVDSEVPAPEEGTLIKILVAEGEVAQVGQAIALIETSGEGNAPTSAPTPVATVATETTSTSTLTNTPVADSTPEKISYAGGDRFYSPLVKNIASSEGISKDELDTIPGTGQNGRVTKKDIKDYISNRGNKATAAGATTSPVPPTETKEAPVKATPEPAVSPESYGDDIEVIEMDRMRKLIADYMVKSKQTSPHVTSFVEADVTNVVLWRNKMKNEFIKREGQKLTFTPIFIQAIVKAIKDFPLINVSVVGDKILRKKNVNIGMATALPSGNLIVPVIKNADALNLTGLAKAVNNLSDKARNNKLSPDDIQGGTYTISNVGSFGNLMGTPIINQPEVAVMAVGAIVKKPSVIETPEGDFIGIRHKMFLSHSYDHRVVDGALGGMFVRKVADYLENFDPNTQI